MVAVILMALLAAGAGGRLRKPDYYRRLVRVVPSPPAGQDLRCLKKLSKLGVRFQYLDKVKGCRTPVWIRSKRLGGVRWRKSWSFRARFILDCSMVLALVRLGPAFRRLGFHKLYFASPWRYSLRADTGQLSKHASGVAVDVSAGWGPRLGFTTVVRDYERGRSNPRRRKGRAWRKLLALLQVHFAEVYGPDYDKDHRDHFHVAAPKVGRKSVQVKP